MLHLVCFWLKEWKRWFRRAAIERFRRDVTLGVFLLVLLREGSTCTEAWKQWFRRAVIDRFRRDVTPGVSSFLCLFCSGKGGALKHGNSGLGEPWYTDLGSMLHLLCFCCCCCCFVVVVVVVVLVCSRKAAPALKHGNSGLCEPWLGEARRTPESYKQG